MTAVPLPLHLFIHFTLAVLAGFSVGYYYNKLKIGIIAGIIGGFLIDLDHVLEYFLVYGWHFNIIYFFQGREFLLSDKIHIYFHAWEYLPILLILAWLLRKKKTIMIFILALTLGIFFHLTTDHFINQYPWRNYSLIYRVKVNFSAPRLLSPEQYQNYILDRQELNI